MSNADLPVAVQIYFLLSWLPRDMDNRFFLFSLKQPSVHLKAFVIACLLRLSLQTDFLDLWLCFGHFFVWFFFLSVGPHLFWRMSFWSRYSTSAEVLLVLNKEGILSSFRLLPIMCLISQLYSCVLQDMLLSLPGFILVFFPPWSDGCQGWDGGWSVGVCDTEQDVMEVSEIFCTGLSDRACTISLVLTLLSCECLVTIQRVSAKPFNMYLHSDIICSHLCAHVDCSFWCCFSGGEVKMSLHLVWILALWLWNCSPK